MMWEVVAELFWRWLLIGALAFGGGQAALSLVERTVVADTGWLAAPDFAAAVAFAFITPGPVAGTPSVKPGMLPAGKYVTATHTGSYDNLERATGEVIAWAKANGVRWESNPEGSGERFVSRFEIYPNGPDDEPDPNRWVTEIWIKTRD